MTDKSVAQRSQTTGHLVLKLLKANYNPPVKTKKVEEESKPVQNKTIFLEVEDKTNEMDFSKIVENSKKVRDLYENKEIPPLEYA